MQNGIAYVAAATVTAINLTYYDGIVQTVAANTITPSQRGLLVRYETTGTANAIFNDIASESGLIQALYYWQFEQFLDECFAYCPLSSFTYTGLTTAQALYVEAMFAGIQSQLTPGIVVATQKGVKRMKSPVGSEVELFESAEIGSRNMEYISPIAQKVGAFLCGVTPVSLGLLMPLFEAFGLRVEEDVKEGINGTATIDIKTVPTFTF